MDLRKLKTLIDLVSESNVSELEITEAEGKVRIVKGAGIMPQAYAMPVAAMTMPAVAPTSAVVASTELDQAVAGEPDVNHAVKSPMVGTFYRSASPGSKPFVEVGDTIKQGETLCIIEAMKILNEIESDKTGTVTKILCDNGQAVEYGQPLYLID
jgi:acetyl-CoA carboxylase biotin carboxyl carrier protein